MSGKTLLNRLSPVASWFRSSEMVAGLILAVMVGLASGLGAVVFRWLIGAFQLFFLEGGSHFLSFLGDYYIIVVPAIGGLLVGPLVYYFAREAKGHGVPEVMEAVALRGGRIRPRVALVKVMAPSICIGSGGSVGREGPIVQIGSTVGLTIGQWLKMPDEMVRVMVACGAAGGIAATFNAPIAGVLFALEVILGRVVTRRFGYVVISTTVSRVMRRENIYTLKLLRRGVDLEQEELGDVLRTTTVAEAMTRDYPTLPATLTINQLIKLFQESGHHGFPVLDEEGRVVGVLTEPDIARHLGKGSRDRRLTAGDIVTGNPFVAYPDQTLDRLLEAIEESEARIPVVSRENQQLLGVVGRHELISTYRKKARRRIPPRVRR